MSLKMKGIDGKVNIKTYAIFSFDIQKSILSKATMN